MSVIIDLVTTAAKKLIELIPLWIASSAEKRAEIEAKASALVSGLDAIFAAADVKDAAATKAAEDAIKTAEQAELGASPK